MNDSERQEINKLLLFLENADKGFCIVEVNEVNKQYEILKKIRGDLRSKTLVIVDFASASEDVGMIGHIAKHITYGNHNQVLAILNLHAISKFYGGDDGLIKEINFNREAFTALDRNLAFFFPSYFVDGIAQHAPDFWDFAPVNIKISSDVKGIFQRIAPDTNTDMADERYWKNRIEFLENSVGNDFVSEKGRLENLMVVADAYEKLYEYQEALKRNQDALELAEKLKDKERKCRILIDIASIHNMCGDYDQANENLTHALAVATEISDRRLEAVILNNMSDALDKKGDVNGALCKLEKSLAISREAGYSEGIAAALNNISQVYLTRGQYQRALECLKESLELSKRNATGKGVQTILNNIGAIYYDLQDYKKAIEYMDKSLSITKETGGKKDEATALNNLGQLYIAMGDYTRALEYLQRSLQLSQTIGDKRGIGICYYNIGQLHSILRNNLLAMDYLIKSWNMAKAIKDRELEDIAMKNIDSFRQTVRNANVHYESYHKKAGRNNLCPCGSGKKYKKCCGKTLE